MKKIKAALQHLADRLTHRKGDLAKSRRLARHFRELAELEHQNQIMAENAGSARLAARRKRRAQARHVKAIYWKGRVREDTAAIANLEGRIEDREKELAEWIKTHGVTFEGHNKVRGGTPSQRKRAAILRAELNYLHSEQPGYYSQEGAARAYDHGLYHYPQGHIWDCSTFADGIHYVCGIESPSGSEYRLGGYTGTELANSHSVSRSRVKPGDLCVYLRYAGDTVGHHVEVVLDPDAEITIGHGDAAINRAGGGSTGFNLFGDGLYTFRRMDDPCPALN